MPKGKQPTGDSRLSGQEPDDSILSLLPPEGAQGDRSVRQIAVDRVTINAKQPRLALPPLAIDELTASIRDTAMEVK